MNWHTHFYEKPNGEKPVEEYLDSLPAKDVAKVLRSMELLEEFGPSVGSPHVETINRDIKCLRVKRGSNIFRVFFFTWIDQKLVMLHGFTKKTPKAPPLEISRAMAYRSDFLKQEGRESNE